MKLREQSLFLSLLAAASAHCGPEMHADAGGDTVDVATDMVQPTCPDAPMLTGGSADGHAQPLMASATEARAGRLTQAQLPHDRTGLSFARAGDYVLANDHVGVIVAAARAVDGYMPWGGKIVGLARVQGGALVDAADFNEGTFAAGRFIVQADSVTVTNDGSNGQPASVRAIGMLTPIPFLDEFARPIAPFNFGDLRVALDYELRPGADSVDVYATFDSRRVNALEIRPVMHGFFQGYRMHRFGPSPEGFATDFTMPQRYVAYIDDGATSYAWAPPNPLTELVSESGFDALATDSINLPGCMQTRLQVVHLTVGSAAPGLDGLVQALAHEANQTLREIRGIVTTSAGGPAQGVHVHATSSDGNTYLDRADTGTDGSYAIHVPANSDVRLTAWRLGDHVVGPVAVAASEATANIRLMPAGRVHLIATEEGSNRALPVRVQLIPDDASLLPNLPASFGEDPPHRGRLQLEYPPTGNIVLQAPVGTYHLVVSHGFEYEISDTAVTITENNQSEVNVSLRHSVDTTDYLCGDLHIHTRRSPDAPDDATLKLSSLIADGIEVPVRSDHEFVGDFASIIDTLGVSQWAHAVPSIELTTFTWGHFGVIPFPADPTARNAGSPPWANMKPPQVFAAVRAAPSQPTIVINHPSSGRSASAYFRAAGFDPTTGTAARADYWDTQFSAVEVFNGSDFEANRDASVRDWFSLLNHGRHVFTTGSSDSHQIASDPAGYPRTCMRLGTDDPRMTNDNAVRDAIAQGHGSVSGGVFITARTMGGVLTGDTASGVGATTPIRVRVQAPTWVRIARLEVFVDGMSVQTIALDGSQNDPSNPVVRFDRDITVPVAAAGSWVVFAVHSDSSVDLSPVHPGLRAFGVTNPIFLTR